MADAATQRDTAVSLRGHLHHRRSDGRTPTQGLHPSICSNQHNTILTTKCTVHMHLALVPPHTDCHFRAVHHADNVPLVTSLSAWHRMCGRRRWWMGRKRLCVLGVRERVATQPNPPPGVSLGETNSCASRPSRPKNAPTHPCTSSRPDVNSRDIRTDIVQTAEPHTRQGSHAIQPSIQAFPHSW